jgi:hypothetical protein
MASMPSNSEETRDFLITIDNSKNTMSQIQNQDFLFRPFVSAVVSMKSRRRKELENIVPPDFTSP